MPWLLQSFPPYPGPETPTYALDRSAIDFAEAWVEPLGVEENKLGAIRALVESQKALAQAERLESEIRRLPSLDEANQFVLVQAMRALAYTGQLPVDLMRECLWNDEWRYAVWHTLTSANFTNLWDAIIELQLQQRGDWIAQLPHLWVGMCNDLDESEERYSELIDHLILGSVNADAASALKRLLVNPNRTVMKRAADWRERLEVAIQLSTPWPQAKLRGFLSILDLPSLVADDDAAAEESSPRTDALQEPEGKAE